MEKSICIICKETITHKSIEHIVPQSIGGRKHIDSVCRRCNNKLGEKVDCLLTEDPRVVVARAQLGLKNKHGEDIDLSKRFGFFDPEGKRVIIKRGNGKDMPELYDGTKNPEVSVLRTEGDRLSIKWSGSDLKSVSKKLKRELEKCEYDLSKAEINTMLQNKRETNWSFTIARTSIVSRPDNYLPCILKIVYETACLMLGESYLSDSLGDIYRRFLFSMIYDQIKPAVEEKIQFVVDWDSLSNNHVVMFRRVNQDVFADVCVLGALRGSLCVSHDAGRYGIDSSVPIFFAL